MSPRDWRLCPQCSKWYQAEIAKRRKLLEDQYGKIPMTEWHQEWKAIEATEKLPQKKTLAVDYFAEIGQDGEFKVEYSANCTECGFRFIHRHSEQVTLEDTEGE